MDEGTGFEAESIGGWKESPFRGKDKRRDVQMRIKRKSKKMRVREKGSLDQKPGSGRRNGRKRPRKRLKIYVRVRKSIIRK